MSYAAVRKSSTAPSKYGTADNVDSLQKGKTIPVYLKNTTRYSDTELEAILQFSMPPGIPDFDVTATKRFRDLFKGTCYPQGCRLHRVNPYKPLIIVRVSDNERDFPYWVERGSNPRESKRIAMNAISYSQYNPRRRGYISTLLRNSRECLVYLIAHELRHLYQAKNKTGWIYGSKGKRSSERDADAYAITKVRAWRKNNMAREVEQAYDAASIFLSLMLQRMTLLSRIILNRRSSV
jgi:hypothetical protein